MLTPQENPGGQFRVSGATATGFTINLSSAPAGDGVTFGYQVVGTFTGPARHSSAKAKAAASVAARSSPSANRN